ncbi:MAG: right-handed parallel beta-helix repeat-containing protein [Nanoarchaeota archaeon]|nr:right-handed parallel beta-helix repeat-containing protein [Nanoarchaeota archaeon]
MASSIRLKNDSSTEFEIVHEDGSSAKRIASADMTVAVDTIVDFPVIASDGDVVIVRDLNRGGTFIYDSAEVVNSNGGTNFSGWIRQYSGAVNVVWFGAKEDGTDSSNAIQSAIDLYEEVYINGSFRIASQINVPSNKVIFGTDSTTSELYCTDGYMTSYGGQSLLVLDSDASNIVVKNIKLNGNVGAIDLSVYPNVPDTSPTLTSAANLIVLQSNENIKIHSCSFVNSVTTSIKEYGLFSVGTAGIYISVEDCFFDNVLGNCIDGEIKNIRVVNNNVNLIGDIRGASSAGSKGGLIVAKTEYGTISGNTIRQTTDSTIYVVGEGAGHISIVGNTIRYSGKDAIKVLESASDCVIIGNTVIAAGSSCIGIYDNGVTDYGNSIISDNIIGYTITPTDILDPLNEYAVKTIDGCNNQSALWNTVYDRTGISLSASNCKALGNKITNVLGLAIGCTEDHCQILGNFIENCSGVGIRQQNMDFIISNNTIVNVGTNTMKAPDATYKDGIQLRTSAQKGIVSNNRIDTTQQYGIYAFSDTRKVNINSNNINGCVSYSIYINGAGAVGSVKFMSLQNNIIEGTSGTRAIYTREVDKITVTGNIIDTASDGIRIDAGTTSIISNNAIYNTADGIRVSGVSTSTAVTGNTADTATRGVVVDSGCANATVHGNIGLNCTTSTVTSGSVNTIPTTVSDNNI